MTVRFLPPDEWPRLAGSPLGPIAAQMSPDTAEVLVVEDDEGQIIGTWCDTLVLHLEGFWVDPTHQGKAAVAKALLRSMFDHLRTHGVKVALTAAPGPKVAGFLERLGGTPVAATSYLLPVPEEF